MLCYRDEERTIFGIIKRYLRFVDAQQGKPLDLNRTRAWIDKQVAPMERVLHEIDAYWGNQKTMQSIRGTILTDKHRQIIEQYTVGADQLENGLFEEITPESEQSKKDDHADQSE